METQEDLTDGVSGEAIACDLILEVDSNEKFLCISPDLWMQLFFSPYHSTFILYLHFSGSVIDNGFKRLGLIKFVPFFEFEFYDFATRKSL